MKKTLKWTGIVVGSLLALVLLAAVLVPVLFKDQIKKAIDDGLAKSVNADVLFDVENFDLTLFKNFPNVTASMKDLGVFNRAPFEGEYLFVVKSMEVEINLKDILFGDQISIKGITLVNPVINVKVLPDGRANYDIAIPSDEVVEEETGDGDFSVGIDHWEIVDGDLKYDDQSLPFLLAIHGLNHTGSGDFTQDVFDLQTNTTIDSLTTAYDGAEYLTNKHVAMDMTLSISEDISKFDFKENTFALNDFTMSFNGWFKMNESDYDMDIAFKSPDNSFKSLLSLVPGMYTESYNNIETRGDLAFDGFAKGKYSDTQMPAFNVTLLVKDAMFKYPDLPTAITNINLDMLIDNKDGIIDNTLVHVKKFHMDLGANPVDANILIENLRDYKMDANVVAKLNLEQLSTMFPMEGLEMKGTYGIDLTAKGVYDSIRNIIPAINANMTLSNGYVKSSEFPIPLHDMNFAASVKNSSGKMEETFIAVKDFTMVMDDEKLSADLLLENLNDYTWDLNATGGIDLEKITKIFPMEGMELAGKVNADLHTKGKYSDLEAERYDKLPTTGTATLTAFKYTASDLPYAVAISNATMSFDPKKINLEKMDGTIGKSDFSVNGSVLNYMGYALGNETINGVVNFNSKLLDLNEFMTESTSEEETTESYGVIPVPQNITFTLKSTIATVKMMDFTMTNAKGDIIVKDGIANLKDITFDMLGGSFGVAGSYNTKDLNHPLYDLALSIDKMSIKEAANSFSLVQTYAPIAGLVDGNFSTDFELAGELNQDMTPNLATVDANGLVKIIQATLKDSPLLAGVTSLTKLDNTNQATLKNVLMSINISDGRLGVKPFDVNVGEYTTNIAGSTGLDGSIAYALKMDVPAGKLGSQFNSLLTQYGAGGNPDGKVPVSIALTGDYKKPVFSLLMDEQKKQVETAIVNAAKQEGTKAVQEAIKGTELEKTVGAILGGTKTDSTKTDSTKVADPLSKEAMEKKAAEEAKKKIQNLLKKKNN